MAVGMKRPIRSPTQVRSADLSESISCPHIQCSCGCHVIWKPVLPLIVIRGLMMYLWEESALTSRSWGRCVLDVCGDYGEAFIMEVMFTEI